MPSAQAPDRSTSTAPALAALAFLIVALWAGTALLRWPFLAPLSNGAMTEPTSSTLKFARNWHREGALHLRFAMVELPASPEYPTLESREIYPTYPPGAIVPAWLASALLGRDPTPRLLMVLGLLLELAIALALAAIAWSLDAPAWLALVPPALFLLLPGPLYFFCSTFFADEVVLLPAALALLWEIRRARAPRRYDALAFATFAWGLATDWLFLPLALVFGLWRLLQLPSPRRLRPSLRALAPLWLPCALVLSLYALQVQWLGQWPLLLARGAQRTQLAAAKGADTADFGALFWGRNVPLSLGPLGTPLVLATLALLAALALWAALRKQFAQVALPLGAGAALAIGCLLQNHLLAEHSSVHLFGALKLALVIALVPFCVAPLAIAQLTGRRWPLALGPLFAALYLATALPHWRTLFPPLDAPDEGAARFLARHAQRADVVFSPDLQIGPGDLAALALSGKIVHLAHAPATLGTAPGARLCLLARDTCKPAAFLAGAQAQRGAGYLYLRLDPETSARLLREPPSEPFCR